MQSIPRPRAFVAAVIATMVSVTASAATPTPPPGWCGFRDNEAIVVERSRLDSQGAAHAGQLLLARPASGTVAALTPLREGVIDSAATWSPRGERIAFERSRRAGAQGQGDRAIFSVDPAGSRVQRLSRGPGEHLAPAWASDNRIAFVARHGDHDCLGMMDAHGRHQRDLFCAPSPARMKRPAWSSDGASVLVTAGYFIGGQDPSWHSLAYRVDAATGSPTVLEDRVLVDPLQLELSPDGSRGIYADVVAAPMVLIDFVTGAVLELGSGYAPRWSRDGQRVAFTGEVYEDGPEFRYYEPLYVMDADGDTRPRIVTRSRVDNHAYLAAEWSEDGSRLLVNRRVFTDSSRTSSRLAVRVVHAETGAVTRVADGQAAPGAWSENCAAPLARPALRAKGLLRHGAVAN